MVSVCKVDVLLVKNGRPLKGSTVDALASGAMAVFRGQRSITAQLVFHPAAVAFSFPLDIKVLTVVVNAVRCAVLPLVFLAMRR